MVLRHPTVGERHRLLLHSSSCCRCRLLLCSLLLRRSGVLLRRHCLHCLLLRLLHQ